MIRDGSRHFSDLANGNHHSIKLQRSYNKHGNVFKCSILEEIPYEKDLIIERENFWINKLNTKENGYNIADASFGDTYTNNPKKEEILAKRSKTVKAKMKAFGSEKEKNYTANLVKIILIGSQKDISSVYVGKEFHILQKHALIVVNVQAKIILSLEENTPKNLEKNCQIK